MILKKRDMVTIMIRKLLIASILAGSLAAAGCLEWETEVRILPDGSGIFSTWITGNRLDAALTANILQKDVQAEVERMASMLKSASEDIDGVEFLDDALYDEGEKLVFRYRYVFDNVGALNKFWRSPAAKQIPYLLAGATLDFKSGGGLCGNYGASMKIDVRNPDHLLWPAMEDFGRLEETTYRQVLDKLYSGDFRLRLVLPGTMKAGDAKIFDLRSVPLYQMTINDLFAKGMKADALSVLPCKKDGGENETPEQNDRSLSLGPAPTFTDVAFVAKSLPRYFHVSVQFEQAGRHKADVTIEIEVKRPAAKAAEFIMPLFFSILPSSVKDMDLSAEKDDQGNFKYIMRSKKAIDFYKVKSPVVFLGRDKGRDVFRMHLPAFAFDFDPSEGREVELLRVVVKMNHDVAITNATLMDGDKAVWRLTDRMLSRKIVLEALSK